MQIFTPSKRLQLRHYSVIGVNFGPRLELIRASPKIPLHVKMSLGDPVVIFNQFYKYKHIRFKVFLYFLVAVDAISYTYTIGIDSVDEFLFCREPDTAIQLSTLKWRRMGTVRYFSNPLDLITQGSILTYTNSQPMECINTANNQSILRVGLIFQGFL